jgi:hypothetical protein
MAAAKIKVNFVFPLLFKHYQALFTLSAALR